MAAPTRRELLLGAAAAAGLGLPRGAAAALPPGHRLIVVTATGGWDVSYVLDPKPSSEHVDGPELDEDVDDADDREALQSWGDLTLTTNASRRPAVTRFFDSWADQSTVVRGLWVGSIAHDACRIRMLTGTVTERSPDVAAVFGDAAAQSRDVPLPTLDLGGVGYAGPFAASNGRLGRNRQLRFLLDRSLPLEAPANAGYARSPQYAPAGDDLTAIQRWVADRDRAMQAAWADRPGAEGRMDALVAARARAARLRTEGTDLAAAMASPTAATLRGQLDLAVDVLDAGLSAAVLVDSGGFWDTHTDNTQQHALWNDLFRGLDALLTRLQDDGTLATTTVLVTSEMTRTPKRNGEGGKDHWPVTSAMVLGGIGAGGRVLGATNDRLDAVAIDLATGAADPKGTVLRYDHFAAGVLEALGVDATAWFGALPRLAL